MTFFLCFAFLTMGLAVGYVIGQIYPLKERVVAVPKEEWLRINKIGVAPDFPPTP